MKLLTLLIIAILQGCGPLHKRQSVEAPELKVRLENKQYALLQELEPLIDEGWIDRESCDGLLWNSLALIGGADIDLLQAETDGQFFRRPMQDCYIKEESKSSISNDMLTGLMAAMVDLKDSDTLERVYQYGKSKNWIMGEGVLSRTVLRPNGIYLLTRSIEVISGIRKPELDNPLTINPYLPVTKDFERHIQTIGMLLTEKLNGEVTDQIRDRMQENVKEYPGDALFQAACGLFDAAHVAQAGTLILDLDYPEPSYVRGNKVHFIIHQLYTINLLLEIIQ